MSDLYTELLVKRESGGKETAIKVALIAVTVLMALAGLLINPWILIGFAALLVADYVVIPSLDLEFEYLYVNGEMDIDRIMSKQKRKKAGSYDLRKMELMAPWNSHELDHYKQDRNAKMVDYSSRSENAKIYAMIYQTEKGREIVLIEPNEVILKDIERIAPRKVKLG